MLVVPMNIILAINFLMWIGHGKEAEGRGAGGRGTKGRPDVWRSYMEKKQRGGGQGAGGKLFSLASCSLLPASCFLLPAPYSPVCQSGIVAYYLKEEYTLLNS